MFGRKPQGKLVVIIKVSHLFGTSEGIFEKVIKKRIIPLKKKDPYADIYIEVQG